MASLVLTRRRIIAISAAVFLLLVGLVFQPLAVHFAQTAARERGWSIRIRHASVGARGVWFKAVHATRDEISGLEVNVDAILVPWSKVVTREGLVLIGGNVKLPPDIESLRRAASETSGGRRESAHSRLVLRVVGLDVRMPSADTGGASLFVWGISGQAAEGRASFRIDRIEAYRAQSAAVLIGAVLAFVKSNADWRLQQAKIDEAKIAIQKGEVTSGSGSDHAPTVTMTKAGKKVVPNKTDPTDAIQTLSSALAGVQSHAKGLRDLIAHHLSANGGIEVPDVRLRLSLGTQSLNMGPFQLHANTDASRLDVTIEQGSMGTDDRRYFELHVPATPSHIELKGEVGFVSLQALGVKETDFGLAHVDNARLRLSLTASIDEIASKAKLATSGELNDVSLNQSWLASRTVSGINAEFSGNAEVGWGSAFTLKLSDSSLKLGQARADITAELLRAGGETKARVQVNVPLAACDALIESLPSGLAPLASQVKLEGTLALQAGVTFDTAHPNRTDAQWDLANGCRVRGSNLQIAPERFKEPFILEVPDARGAMVERAFGPGTPNWVPLSAMNAHLADAILVCEDGRFFNHSGFDPQAIRASIKDNLLRGKFMRGGSTISMQLAKNLYLRREKTVSRKLQEAVLTLLLEQSFSKNDILELYWNVVELGPGIYGIGEASKFYFDTTPADLSTTQAFFLASILPNPKALHFAADGNVFRGWLNQVRRLLTIAHSRHYLTDEELHQALEEDLHFGSSKGNHPPATALDNEQVEEQALDVPTGG